MNNIATLDVFITGFTQNQGKKTGLEYLWNEVRKKSDENHWVLPPFTWDTDFTWWANFIARNVSNDTRIYVGCYSWGAGRGFIDLCNGLAKHGLKVHHAILCDPVYYSKLLPFRWLAVTNLGTIKIPKNVRNISSFYQEINRPRGHKIKCSRFTKASKPVKLYVKHSEMDDQAIYHETYLALTE